MPEATGVPAKPTSGRVRCIDWLRGLAVLDMIMWHTAGLLNDRHDKTTLGILAGLVAASFMFAAGFAIALVMVRSSGDPAARRRRAIKSLQRIGEVLLVALVLKWILRSGYEWDWWRKLDILSTIAISLLIAYPVMYAGASRPALAAGICGAIGAGLFIVAPHVPESLWDKFVVKGGSDFALVPWAGYVFLGAAVGAMGSMGLTGWGLAGLFTLGMAFRFLPWGAWIIGNAGERFMMFGGVALGLYALEREANDRGWKLSWPPFSFLELIGTSALTAYVVHVWLLYIPTPIVRWSYTVAWYGKLGWGGYWAAVVSLWAVSALVCWGWPRVTAAVAARLPWKKPA